MSWIDKTKGQFDPSSRRAKVVEQAVEHARAVETIVVLPKKSPAPQLPCQKCGCPVFWLGGYGNWSCLDCSPPPDRSFVKGGRGLGEKSIVNVADNPDGSPSEDLQHDGREPFFVEYETPAGSFSFWTFRDQRFWQTFAGQLASIDCFAQALSPGYIPRNKSNAQPEEDREHVPGSGDPEL